MTSTLLPRAALGALALTLFAGCGGDTDFVIRRTFDIQGTGSVAASEAVSLSQVAGDAWDERDKIDDVTVRSAVATITAVGPGNTATTGTVEGAVSRGSGASLESVTVVNDAGAITVGTRIAGQNLGQASGLLRRALEGNGQLTVDVVATIPEGSAADFTVEVVIEATAEWSLF